MNTFKKKLTLRNDVSEIRRISDIVDELALLRGLSAEVKNDINMALEEAVANIIHHGFEDEGEHAIDVEIGGSASEIIMRIEDEGCPFNPLEAGSLETGLPLEERPVGGIGIHLIRNAVDRMDYRREGRKNILTLKKMLADV